ncbi:mitochondrial import protein Pam17-domain-containing protein [Xylogone sp. PMI_703]|nr:mitochondrial import protein Pam17-domain-containing protein [Xylogone sp. PMI_703]
MLCAPPSLRTAVIGCRLQPTLLTYSAHISSSQKSTDITAPLSTNRRKLGDSQIIRHASSIANQTSPSSSQSSTQSTSNSPETLDWNTFFKLRRNRRWYQLGSSIGTGINGFILGAQVLTRSDMDAFVSQIPLDPFITLGLITFTCGGLGWLAGPIVGTAVFNLRNRKFKEQMAVKEKEFYARVKKYRVDPSASSMANPVPDYYGEKISSVQGYRQWLKDQRAFNKKRQTYV